MFLPGLDPPCQRRTAPQIEAKYKRGGHRHQRVNPDSRCLRTYKHLRRRPVYGAGNGTTTFNKPDLRGEFIRGWDAGRGVDAARSLGTAQASMAQKHKHVMAWGEDSSDPAQFPFGKTTGAGKHGASTSDNNNYQFYTNDGSDIDNAVNAAGVIGTETRPRNVALLYCIKL